MAVDRYNKNVRSTRKAPGTGGPKPPHTPTRTQVSTATATRTSSGGGMRSVNAQKKTIGSTTNMPNPFAGPTPVSRSIAPSTRAASTIPVPVDPKPPVQQVDGLNKSIASFDVMPTLPGGVQPAPPTQGVDRLEYAEHSIMPEPDKGGDPNCEWMVACYGNAGDQRWWNWDGHAGHYWQGYPCETPRNCVYGDHTYERPMGQGHGPDMPDLKYGRTRSPLPPRAPSAVDYDRASEPRTTNRPRRTSATYERPSYYAHGTPQTGSRSTGTNGPPPSPYNAVVKDLNDSLFSTSTQAPSMQSAAATAARKSKKKRG